MASHPQQNKVTYVEFSTTSIEQTKAFYGKVFGWEFKDWGPDYIDAPAEVTGVALGFARVKELKPVQGAPLVVLYAQDLEATEKAVVDAGGTIVTQTFDYPGGRRFHFSDGMGNVLSVCSEQKAFV